MEVDLGQPEVSSPPQMHGAYAQRQCPFDARPPAVLLGKGIIGFSRPRGLQRGMLLAPTRREQPARAARTVLLERAGLAVRTGEADADHCTTHVVIGAPTRRCVTGRTGGDLPIPVDLEVLKPEGSRLTPLPLPLPLRILWARPEQRHGMIACTGEQQVGIDLERCAIGLQRPSWVGRWLAEGASDDLTLVRRSP